MRKKVNIFTHEHQKLNQIGFSFDTKTENAVILEKL